VNFTDQIAELLSAHDIGVGRSLRNLRGAAEPVSRVWSRAVAMAKTVLIVEDEALIAEALAMSIEDMGYEVSAKAANCAAALESLWNNPPDLALIDTHLRGETCEVVLNECQKLGVPVIVSTGQMQVPAFCDGLTVLSKPYSEDALRGGLDIWEQGRSAA
jgi:CheY-like chemotaxis protein